MKQPTSSSLEGPPQELGDRTYFNDVDLEVSRLMETLHEKQQTECALGKNLSCAVKTISQLREENQQYREYIEELEEDLQYYADASQLDQLEDDVDEADEEDEED